MKAKETMVCWTPARHEGSEISPLAKTAGKIAAGPWPDETGWSDDYLYSDLACWAAVKDYSLLELKNMCMDIALSAIIRDGLDPQIVDREMMRIDEYRAQWQDRAEQETA